MAKNSVKQNPPRDVAAITPGAALQNFQAEYVTMQGNAVRTMVACATYYIIACHLSAQKISLKEATDRVAPIIETKGLKSRSMFTVYVTSAKALATKLVDKFKLGGPIGVIANAGTADEAVNMTVAFLATQSVPGLKDRNAAHNIDTLRMFSDLKPRQAQAKRAVAGETNQSPLEQAASRQNGTNVTIPKTAATSAIVDAIMGTDHRIDALMLAIDRLTSEDLNRVLKAAQDRLAKLAEGATDMPKAGVKGEAHAQGQPH